jgi:hypothetical protein
MLTKVLILALIGLIFPSKSALLISLTLRILRQCLIREFNERGDVSFNDHVGIYQKLVELFYLYVFKLLLLSA